MLDPDSQSVVGVIPSTMAGGAGHQAALDIYFGLMQRILPDVFCDIGANNGEAGRRAKAILPGTMVFGFEANPLIHARHQHVNIEAGVKWFNLAVSDSSGTIALHIPKTLSRTLKDDTLVPAEIIETDDTGKASLLIRDEKAVYQTVEVPSSTLDEFLDHHAPHGRVALWIDVEGAASMVLRGAKQTLSRTDLVIVEVEGLGFWKDQTLVVQTLQMLRESGFVPVLRDREYGDAQFNVICVRQNDAVEAQKRWLGTEVGKLTQFVPPSHMDRAVITPANTPVLIPCFNNPSYAQGMMTQLQRLGFDDITFVDNASDSDAMHHWLDDAEKAGMRVERLSKNLGPRASIYTAERLANLPRWFCVTDPDLQFNTALPDGFLNTMARVSEQYRFAKVGLALDISDGSALRTRKFTIGNSQYHIWEWEKQFWEKRLGYTNGGDPVFEANVDTTFALHDRNRFDLDSFLTALRIGGRFTAVHLPWLANQTMPIDEANLYRATQKHSFYHRDETIID